MLGPQTGTMTPFTKSGEICIIAEEYRASEYLCQLLSQWDIFPARQIGSAVDYTIVGVERPRRGNPDTDLLIPFWQELGDCVLQALKHAVRAFLGKSWSFNLCGRWGRWMFEKGDPDIRPPEIDSQDR
jgi:hypothetical protein